MCDSRNLGNRRDAVAASELGVDQLYLLPARSLQLGVSYRFDAG